MWLIGQPMVCFYSLESVQCIHTEINETRIHLLFNQAALSVAD